MSNLYQQRVWKKRFGAFLGTGELNFQRGLGKLQHCPFLSRILCGWKMGQGQEALAEAGAEL